MRTSSVDFLQNIDVVILTYNEEANIARSLDALMRFPRVVLLDSGSSDGTLAIAARYPNVRVCANAFKDFAAQWTHALHRCGLASPWVLALDADYVLDAALVDEMAALSPPQEVSGYRVGFRYCVHGHALSASLYPAAVILYRREGASYEQDGHSQRLRTPGDVAPLRGQVSHDDRKSFSVWLAAQDRYARIECRSLREKAWRELNWRDRVRRLVVIAPWLVPLYCLTVGRGLLDGRAGLFYAMQRAIAETILSARLLEAAMSKGIAS
jgi:glycosyltransferase involved in cell wall biosynthesis